MADKAKKADKPTQADVQRVPTKADVQRVEKFVKNMERQPYPDAKSELDNALGEVGIKMPENQRNEILTEYELGPGNAPE